MNNSKPKKNKRAKYKIDWSTVWRLLKYLWKDYKFRLILVVILLFASATVNVSVSMFFQVLIDDYIIPLMSEANPVFTGLLKEILKMAVIAFIGITSMWLNDRIMAQISQGVLKKIRDEMFIHMQKLPINYFDTHSTGDIMSNYTNDTDALRQMMSQSVPEIISAAITIVTVAIAMVITNIYLTVFVAIYLVFMLLITGRVAGNSGKHFTEQQISLAKVNSYVEEIMEGQKVVKVFTHENEVVDEFENINEKLYESTAEANKYANILMPITGSLTNLQYVLIAVLGGIMAMYNIGGLTLGIIASFIQLAKSITRPFTRISLQLNMVVMALAGAKRIFAFLDEKPEEDNGYITLVNAKYNKDNILVPCKENTSIWAWKDFDKNNNPIYKKLEGRIHFNNVDFSYLPNEPILHNISLYAEPGEKVAFVGATGAGKTTITNLINRFYDIDDGTILYDGLNINSIKKSDLRRSLGIVLQDTHLFTDSIMENIRYGRSDATDEEVMAAAELANADSFISRLSNGYDSILVDGGENLSQGQRQLLSIARAAVADPPVMILDEATSSIDTRTEVLVQGGMDSLMVGRTVFVIAHRLSTIQNSDVILVLDLGEIVERGDHNSLLKKKGTYYQLYEGVTELT